MSEKIEPALTPEEWAQWEARVSWARDQGPRPDLVEMASIPENARPHGVAAKLLHDQPFGFTWGDVDRLRKAEITYHVPGYGDVLCTPFREAVWAST